MEETDNAQLQAHLVAISSRVPGTISALAVQDNQTVRAGQLLVALDPRDSQAALRLAQADWVEATSQAQAMAAQASAMASYQQAKGQLTPSRASREQAFVSRSQVGVDQQKAVPPRPRSSNPQLRLRVLSYSSPTPRSRLLWQGASAAGLRRWAARSCRASPCSGLWKPSPGWRPAGRGDARSFPRPSLLRPGDQSGSGLRRSLCPTSSR